MLDIITDNLDVWTTAKKNKKAVGRGSSKKQEAYGIKKLRELILELAVRGKLVPQDAGDEPASVLLERIGEEKEQLIKEGKIKKQKVLPKITEDEKPFKLPNSWRWTKLQDISIYIQRGKGPKYADLGKVRVVSQKCIQWNGFDLEKSRYVDDQSLEAYQAERFLKSKDLLWNSTGTGTVGRIIGLNEIDENVLVADSHVTVIRPLKINNSFLCSYISAPGIQLRIDPNHENSLVSGTTKQVELNTGIIIPLPIPIPPLAEQHRIVAKVDELMALCDQLEQQQSDQSATHQTLVETLLKGLIESAKTSTNDQQSTADFFNQLIAQHFDTLFTTEQSIDQLKQTILQLAVMGKLVPQDRNDEPASGLLEKIAEEKTRLIEAGKIKKQKALPEIGEDEKPFELPDGWEWCRFGNVVNFKSELVRPENFQDFEQIAPDSIEKGNGRLLFRRTVQESGIRGPNNKFYTGQILYSKIRPSLSKVIIAEFDGLCSADMYPLDSLINSIYLLKIMLSEVFLEQVRVAENRIKMPKLNIDSLSNILIPIPTIGQQGYIAIKVNQLLTLCDSLKANLNQAQITQTQLADAIVKQAVN